MAIVILGGGGQLLVDLAGESGRLLRGGVEDCGLRRLNFGVVAGDLGDDGVYAALVIAGGVGELLGESVGLGCEDGGLGSAQVGNVCGRLRVAILDSIRLGGEQVVLSEVGDGGRGVSGEWTGGARGGRRLLTFLMLAALSLFSMSSFVGEGDFQLSRREIRSF